MEGLEPPRLAPPEPKSTQSQWNQRLRLSPVLPVTSLVTLNVTNISPKITATYSFGADGGTRTPTPEALVPKTSASTNSATPAVLRLDGQIAPSFENIKSFIKLLWNKVRITHRCLDSLVSHPRLQRRERKSSTAKRVQHVWRSI